MVTFGNILNLIDELQQLLDYKIVGTNQISRIENLIKDAIEVLTVIPTGGISNFETFKNLWLKSGYTSYPEDEMARYIMAVDILNESSIRIVCETEKRASLFDEPNYILGNQTDAVITKEQYEILKSIGIKEIEIVNG